jgi:hypothetical protein
VVLVAGWHLLLAREVARDCPRPWERRVVDGPLPLARLQRDYGRILHQFGLAMPPPKPRGKAPGRARRTVVGPNRATQSCIDGSTPPKSAVRPLARC